MVNCMERSRANEKIWKNRNLDSGGSQVGRKVSGEKLPSEQELSEQFQVSRQTVRRALEELVKENIVESRRGSGSYICEEAGSILGNIERKRSNHEEKRIAVMLTYIDTYIFPIIVREIEKKVTRAGGVLQIAMTDNSVAKERMHPKNFWEQEELMVWSQSL